MDFIAQLLMISLRIHFSLYCYVKLAFLQLPFGTPKWMIATIFIVILTLTYCELTKQTLFVDQRKKSWLYLFQQLSSYFAYRFLTLLDFNLNSNLPDLTIEYFLILYHQTKYSEF